MACVLGIDLGTSGVKVMLLDEERGVIGEGSASYTVDIPKEGFGEQEPEMWWEAVKGLLKYLKAQYPQQFKEVKSIGFSGQMHGLVLIDKEGKPLRPAILWLDQRTGELAKKVQKELGKEKMGRVMHNRVFAGFAFPSLLWVKENEPELFEKVYKILLPKDYIRMKITGEIGTDASDASSTCIADTGKREWAWDIIRSYGFLESIFPPIREAWEVAGTVTKKCASETGMAAGAKVVFGSGDQPAQSIGNGAAREGLIISNIGTGGQISAYSSEDKYDKELRIHTFCHGVNKAYTVFGAALCSGMSMNWLKNKILYESDYMRLSEQAESAEPGSGGVIYLPYLSGERTPHMNPKATGMFFGLKLQHGREHMIRSVMEGVVFSLKDCLEIMEQIGIEGDQIIASGGGASSEVWLQIQADILEKEVKVCDIREQAALGACIIAGVGAGMFEDVDEAAERFVKIRKKRYEPRAEYRSLYREQYRIYRELYQNNCKLMK